MTNGEPAVTSGERPFRFGAWETIALVGLVVAVVNATSVIMEARRDGDALDPWRPFAWEFSSYLLIIALAPLIGRAIARFPPRRDNLALFALIHAGLTIPFSLLHIAGMVMLRIAAYAAIAGQPYDFFHDDALAEIFYEWRKDVLTYAMVATGYWAFRRFGAPAPDKTDERIEIRDGAAAVFLAPGDIHWVEAAGNYVEFHVGARTHLVRGTLAAWETKLGPRGFARVHRSRLVNRARIREIKPTPSGDFAITLDDGAELAGSRRYRAALESAPAA